MISRFINTQIHDTENAFSIVMTIDGKKLCPRQGITFCSGISGKILGSEGVGASFANANRSPRKMTNRPAPKKCNEHKLHEKHGRIVIGVGRDWSAIRKIDRPQKPKG